MLATLALVDLLGLVLGHGGCIVPLGPHLTFWLVGSVVIAGTWGGVGCVVDP